MSAAEKAERGADQHRHLFVGQMLLGLLEVIEQRVVEVDVTFLAEIAGQLLQHQFVERGAVGDALDVGLDHFVQVADRGVQVDRRVDQQHFLEVEAASGFVQLADECRVQCAKAVAGEVILGHLQLALLGAHCLHYTRTGLQRPRWSRLASRNVRRRS
jgi:hypothetical protein